MGKGAGSSPKSRREYSAFRNSGPQLTFQLGDIHIAG